MGALPQSAPSAYALSIGYRIGSVLSQNYILITEFRISAHQDRVPMRRAPENGVMDRCAETQVTLLDKYTATSFFQNQRCFIQYNSWLKLKGTTFRMAHHQMFNFLTGSPFKERNIQRFPPLAPNYKYATFQVASQYISHFKKVYRIAAYFLQDFINGFFDFSNNVFATWINLLQDVSDKIPVLNDLFQTLGYVGFGYSTSIV